MASGNLVYKEQNLRVERRYFTGTDTIVAGQPFCYQESSATASVTKGFGFDIEIPVAANERLFAGIAAPSAVGITGPDYIDIIVPRRGDIMQVLVSAGADRALGDVLELDWDYPTTLGSELGAFNQLVIVSASGSVDGSDLDPLLVDAHDQALCAVVGASLASTAETRALQWVRFI